MRRRFAITAALAAFTQIWACGEFISDAPNDANLTGPKDGPPTTSQPSKLDGGPDTESSSATTFTTCADPSVAGALLCEDFSAELLPPRWVLKPVGTKATLIKHEIPDLLVQGAFTTEKQYYLHDFPERDTSFEVQLKLTVNAPVEGNAQVLALYLGNMRSLGFLLEGNALSVFRYDDDAIGTKALVPLLPDARGSHTLRLVATAGATWKFHAAVDNRELQEVPAPFADLPLKLQASIAMGFLGGTNTGNVDYSIDNILVR